MERIKEELAYLRLWLGAFIAIEIGLFGWMASHLTKAPSLLWIASAIGFVLGAAICDALHGRVRLKLREMS